MKNILVLQPGGIGDTVMSLPALRALREAFPESRVDVAFVDRAASGLLGNEYGYRAFLLPYGFSFGTLFRTLLELRRKRYDLCFVPTGVNPWRAGLFALLIGAQTRVGERRGRIPSLFYTHTMPLDGTLHVLESNERLLAQIHVPVRQKLPSLRVPEEAAKSAEEFFASHGLVSRNVIGFHIGSLQGGGVKRWPMRHAQAFGRLVRQRLPEARILVFGAPNERELCQEIAGRMGDIALFAVGQPLQESIALVARCAAFVGPDGGLPHIAAALGVPTVALFGPMDPRRFRPRGKRVRVVQEYCRDMRTAPDQPRAGRHECMERIMPERVYSVLERLP